jgi:hypothetical protein
VVDLDASDFENTNPDDAVTVTVTGNVQVRWFTGFAWTIPSIGDNGISIDNALYTEEDFTFSGVETVTRTAPGVTVVDLDASDFENTNPNFANVKFVVTDGQLTVLTLTVTYTDGVGGAAFANQVTNGLAFNDPTPAFIGTPQREGFDFVGWAPAVAPTVTANTTYTAQWAIANDEEEPEPQPEPQPEPPVDDARNNEEEIIEDDPTALTGLASWALVNLISMIATVLSALGMIITFFRKKEGEDTKRMGSKFIGLVPAAGSVIAFILTQDLSGVMTIVDKWTVLMVGILAVSGVTAYFTRNRKPEAPNGSDVA